MKNAIKVLCFVVAVILIGTAGTYFYFTWDKGEFEYVDGIDKSTVTVTGYIGNETEIVIPKRLRGKKVTSISENAFEESKLVSVEIGGNVNTIGKDAFSKCESLKNVTIKEGVKSIGETAFYQCTSLESIKIPSTVEKLGDAVFYNSAVKDIEFVSDKFFKFEDGVIYNSDKTIIFQALTTADISEFTCPDSVTAIYPYAFAGHEELKSIKLNEGMKKLDTGVFIDCKGLTELKLPSTLVSVGSLSVSGSGIKKIYIPKTTVTFEKTSFYKMEEQLVIVTTKNSAAAKFAEKNGFKTEIVESL